MSPRAPTHSLRVLLGGSLAPAFAIGWAAALTLSAPPAEAQTFESYEPHGYRESPRRLAFELKFTPYVPAIDASPVLQRGSGSWTPFSDFFGSDGDRAGLPPNRGLLTQGEVDYQFLNRFGSLGVGLSGGYYRISAPAFTSVAGSSRPACSVDGDINGWRVYRKDQATADGKGTERVTVPYSSCISGDETIFNLVPVSLLLVYRFDELSKRFRIPLIPYIKAGFGAYFWWVGSSASFVSTVTTQDSSGSTVTRDASGATYGLVVHPGLALDLSAIDLQASRVIDAEIGLNRVSLFVELHSAFMSGWAQKNKLDLSDLTFNAGINFEF